MGLGLQILCGPRFGAAAVETVKESLVETPKIPTPDVVKAPVAAPEEKPAVSKREKYLYAIGRRKTAVAKVRAFPGSAEFQVNKRPFGKYFQTKDLQKTVLSPLSLLGLEKELGFEVFVSGSGIHSQADAVRHAIARLLILRNPEDKRTLKKAGFLTRDPRVKERKKPGLKRARRGPQWAKR
ncbi:MAG: 30S ribosomal protein S9 [Patescibacteria group bacterium]|nr:30S ribosomal protein S9 [Patescibacteria group bacterium]